MPAPSRIEDRIVSELFAEARTIFCLKSSVMMTEFDDRALLFKPDKRFLFSMNAVAYHILTLITRPQDVHEIAAHLTVAFDVSRAEAVQDTLAFYDELLSLDLIDIIETLDKENKLMDEHAGLSRFIRNPDVTLREEDENGGLLFNPDSGQVNVVNSTGLFIWQQCDGSRSLADIVTSVQDAFGGAPADEIADDVQAFLDEVIAEGFIGVVKFSRGE